MKLYTAGTPNGWKVSIMLEELVETGELTEVFEVHQVDLMAGEQFSPDSSPIVLVSMNGCSGFEPGLR